jgi:hypothetical protein
MEGVGMKKCLVLLLLGLSFACQAADYESTMLVQTGKLRESDLIVRTITDLDSNKICLAFYVSTTGTSPVISCYDARQGYRSKLRQVGHFKEGKLIVRKMKDTVNDVSCLVAYVSTPGTSPSIDCYQGQHVAKDEIVRQGHLREGDLELYRVVDPSSTKACLIAYVNTEGTAPSLHCYDSPAGGKGGGMTQSGFMREGDLVVRKILDQNNNKECLVTYVSTQGTSPNVYCYNQPAGRPAPMSKATGARQ